MAVLAVGGFPLFVSRMLLAMVVVMVTIIPSCKVAIADPILAPELRYCHLPLNLPDGEDPFDCCAPNWDKPAIDFEFNESAPLNVKVRPPAHALDAEYAAKVERAYTLMKNLPSDDPRSFLQQANIHCAYCSATYQMGNSSTPLQVHTSWLFFSFHRWYIYFHERILAHLLEDDTFALPFWNYDHPDGMTIPEAYMTYPNLTDPFREPSHLPPSKVMIDYYLMNASIRTYEEQTAANLATIYRMVVSGATTQSSFFGLAYRKDDGPEPGFGTLETMPHNSVHGWTGDQFTVGKKDMGTLYAAGRDPVFYTHHANLDRLWEVWKTLGNEDIDDSDYLQSEFVFYDEYAQLIKVNIKDSFDTIKLGYTYAPVENVWLNSTTARVSDGVASLTGSELLCEMGKELIEPCSIVLSRDKENALVGEEILVIEGIEGVLDTAAHFEAYVNLPEAAGLGLMINCSEYVGRFSRLPQMLYTNMTGNYYNTTVEFVIGTNVEELGLGEEESLVVTLVPRVESSCSSVTFTNIKLRYETQGLSQRRREVLRQSVHTGKAYESKLEV